MLLISNWFLWGLFVYWFICLFLIIKFVRFLICRIHDTFQIFLRFSIMEYFSDFFKMLLLFLLLVLDGDLFRRQGLWLHVDGVDTFSHFCNCLLDLTDFLYYSKDTSSSCEHSFRLSCNFIVIILCSSALSIISFYCSFIDF